MAALANKPTLRRLLLLNGAAIVAVFCFLAVTPAPVTFPNGPWESALLLKGGALLLLVNVLVARLTGTAAGRRRAGLPTSTESLTELRRFEHYYVADETGVVGLVGEAIADRTGHPVGVLVVSGWFGARRFFLPLGDIGDIDDDERTLSIRKEPWPVPPPIAT